MRKVKSTALLGAFVAVASLGVISHEAHGGTIVGTNIIAKEMLPNSSASLQASIEPSVGFSGSSITLKISGASFIDTNNSSYTISGAGASCTSLTYTLAQGASANSLTFSSCTVSAGDVYAIVGPTASSSSYFSVSVPASSSSIVLSYSSNAATDTSTSATIATVQQQLSFAPISAGTAYINPTSLSTFLSGSYVYSAYAMNSHVASNSVVLSNSAYGNKTWSTTIPSIIMNFLFTGIPTSVTSISASDINDSQVSVTPGNQSATVSLVPAYAFDSSSLDTITFKFYNSNGLSISTGSISLSSISGSYGIGASSTSYVYSSTPQPFLSFAIGGTQLYIPDALVSDGNAINYSYLTISMPQGASIASISVLNTGVSCSVSSISLASTSTTGVSYIDLSQLPQACPGITPIAWQAGVPLVIYIDNATPNQVTADAYAVFLDHLKRIPVNVLNIGNSNVNFSY